MIRIMVTALFLVLMCAQIVVLAKTPAKVTGANDNGRGHLIRKAFVMTVNAGQEKEYARRHQPIWPELEATLKAHGVRTYTIFLLPETRQLFAYVEFDSLEQWNSVAKTEVCQKWWAHMKDVMPSNPDNSPVSIELKELFHIENMEPAHTLQEKKAATQSSAGK